LLPTIRSRCQRIDFRPLPATMRADLDGGAEAATALAGHIDALEAALAGSTLAIYRAAESVAGDKAGVVAAVRGLAERLHQRARALAVEGRPAAATVEAARARRVLICLRG